MQGVWVHVGSIPGQGARIPHASGPKIQNRKQKQCCNKFSKDLKNGPHKKKKIENLKKNKTKLLSPVRAQDTKCQMLWWKQVPNSRPTQKRVMFTSLSIKFRGTHVKWVPSVHFSQGEWVQAIYQEVLMKNPKTLLCLISATHSHQDPNWPLDPDTSYSVFILERGKEKSLEELISCFKTQQKKPIHLSSQSPSSARLSFYGNPWNTSISFTHMKQNAKWSFITLFPSKFWYLHNTEIIIPFHPVTRLWIKMYELIQRHKGESED